jgi:hypothetical protein
MTTGSKIINAQRNYFFREYSAAQITAVSGIVNKSPILPIIA